MREIKFRIWDSQFNNWVNPDDIRMNCATGEVHGKFSCGNVPTWKLEQFIGQSDANSVEIFDGDIVLCIAGWRRDCHTEQGDMKLVEFDIETSGFEPFCDYDGDCGYFNKSDHFIVIGNIHENKEFKTLGYIYGFEPQKI